MAQSLFKPFPRNQLATKAQSFPRKSSNTASPIARHVTDFTWNRGCSSNTPPLKHGDQIPHPLEDSDNQIPSSPGRQRCQMPGVCPGGGMLKLRFDRYIISSNSSFISFWRRFRGIFWEVLWTLELTQSQVGIVGWKIVNSLNRCIKFRKRNRLLRTLVAFCYRFVDFLTLNTLTQLYFKKPIYISDQYCFEKLPNNKRFGAYRNSHLVVLRSEVTFFRPFLASHLHLLRFVSARDFIYPKILFR